MKKILFILNISLFLVYETGLAQVGIGTVDVNSSAIMEIKSNNRGFLTPRMTANQKNTILNPAEGLTLFCTNCCENGTLVFHNGSTWQALIGCPDYDLDLDGVPNATDLDDDNDGILDINEGSEAPIASAPTSLTNITPGMDDEDLEVGDVLVYENFISNIGGNPVDLRAECVIVHTNNADDKAVLKLSSASRPVMSFTDFEWENHDHFVVKFTFVESGSVTTGNLAGTPIDVPNIQVNFTDIESIPNKNVSEIGGFGESFLKNGTAVNHTLLTVPDAQDTWIKFGSRFRSGDPRPTYSQYNLITVDRSYAGATNNWEDEGSIDGNSTRGTAIIKFDTLSTVDLLFGATGGGTSGDANRAGQMVIASTHELNTTGSGEVDLRNLDSDGDGCFDALEGGAGFTDSDIDLSGKLLGAVDANGVPILAGSTGQTAGTSTDVANSPCP